MFIIWSYFYIVYTTVEYFFKITHSTICVLLCLHSFIKYQKVFMYVFLWQEITTWIFSLQKRIFSLHIKKYLSFKMLICTIFYGNPNWCLFLQSLSGINLENDPLNIIMGRIVFINFGMLYNIMFCKFWFVNYLMV